MKKLLLVFDYFKETFHLNKQNKSLYIPQIALIAINVLIVLAAGIGLYRWIGVESITDLFSMESSEIFMFLLNQGFKLLAIGLVYAVISVIVEAGLLNMYKSAVTQGYTQTGDFKQGVSKYFIRLLLGKLFILVCYLLAIPLYLIIGVITLTVGLTVIPLVASIFLCMWKVSLVMNDSGIFAAIGDSFRFATKNFIPLTFLQMIYFAFKQGGSSGNNLNFNQFRSIQNYPFMEQSALQPEIEQVIGIFKIVIAILIPIVVLAVIGVSLIGIVFEVFFSLALFVAYKNNFHIEEAPQVTETTELVETEDNQTEETNESKDYEEVEQ